MSTRRPRVTYDRALAILICAEVAKGRSLRDVCSDPNMPDESTVRTWALDDKDGFAERYDRATCLRADALGDRIQDMLLQEDMTEEQARVVRVRVDGLLKLLGKLAPKRWADRPDLQPPPAPAAITFNIGTAPAAAAALPPPVVIEGKATGRTEHDR